MRLDGPWRRDPPPGLVASGKRRYSAPVVTTVYTTMVILAATAVYLFDAGPDSADRLGCSPQTSGESCSVVLDGAVPAIQKEYRSRALPRFERWVVPRNWPACSVQRSKPQYFRNCRTQPNRRRSRASAKIVIARMGPMPGTVCRRPSR